MNDIAMLHDMPDGATPIAWLLLAHGAGAPMTSPFMSGIARLLAARRIAITRFEFAYMAARRTDGKKRPPPKAERLMGQMVDALTALERTGHAEGMPLLIGGKSMGGRVATLLSDELYGEGRIAGAVALGYPFHPPKKPDALRTSHLENMQTPLFVVQGERDPFGSRAEVERYVLAKTVTLHWAVDGDHDLAPRGGSGTTRKANLAAAADAIAGFLAGIATPQARPRRESSSPSRATH